MPAKNKLKEIFNIKDKTVLITGATGFFGQYISQGFLDVGAKVIMLGRSDKIKGQLKKFRQKYGSQKVFAFQIDFYKRKKFELLLKKITKDFNIDVLINNADDLSSKTGFNTQKGRLENLKFTHWQMAFEAGIYWAVLTTQIIGKQFREKSKGVIINVSSVYGVVSPNPKLYEGKKFFNPATYGARKAATIALTRYTASFWGIEGIRCNAIAPGPFSNTESKTENSVKKNDPFLERLRDRTLLHKLGHPNDLRGLLIYLACDASSYVTGQTISIDGGWTIT